MPARPAAQKTLEEVFPPAKEERRSKIFNSLSRDGARDASPIAPLPKEATTEIPAKEKIEEKKATPAKDDDDDWGAIPAFLRRSKLK
jgi:hypothetical protein